MLLSIVFWLVFNTYCSPTDTNPYQVGDRLFVTANSGVNLRVSPSTKGKILKGVGFNSSILIEDQFDYSPKYEDEIDGKKGHWIKVRSGNQVGYLFDGFLCKLPSPKHVHSTSIIEVLRKYALEQLTPIQPTVSYVQLGKNADYSMHITNLNHRCQLVETEYCDSLEIELVIRSLQLKDIKYLVETLFLSYISASANVENELAKSDEIELSLLGDSFYTLKIVKSGHDYCIKLIPAVDCC